MQAAAAKAVDALDGLNSALSVGVAYRSYSDRIVDAKIVVDRFGRFCPQKPEDGSMCTLLVQTMADYAIARTVWEARVTKEWFTFPADAVDEQLIADFHLDVMDCSAQVPIRIGTSTYYRNANTKCALVGDKFPKQIASDALQQAYWKRAGKSLDKIHALMPK